MTWRFVKLVRNGVGKYLPPEGAIAVAYAPMPTADVAPALRAKLVEEAAEYNEARSAEELADAFEVVRALADRYHGGLENVTHLAAEKRMDRGGFEEAVGMYVLTDPGTSNHG